MDLTTTLAMGASLLIVPLMAQWRGVGPVGLFLCLSALAFLSAALGSIWHGAEGGAAQAALWTYKIGLAVTVLAPACLIWLAVKIGAHPPMRALRWLFWIVAIGIALDTLRQTSLIQRLAGIPQSLPESLNRWIELFGTLAGLAVQLGLFAIVLLVIASMGRRLIRGPQTPQSPDEG